MDTLSKTFGKLSIPLLLLLSISFFASPAKAKYGGGTGGPNDPYLIYDANQMNAIGADSNDWDKCFKLMADIDLANFTGSEFNIIGCWEFQGEQIPFTGFFDGDGHKISNFSYNSADTGHIGLFSYVFDANAQIKDLGLIAPDVDARTGAYVGALVGRLSRGTITNCYVEGGSISGGGSIGGLVGENDESTISNCYSTASVVGNERVGGLVGANWGTISNCYASGSASGDYSVGGLVGLNYGTITNSHSEGDVSGDFVVGGLVGQNLGTISNCYARGSVSGNKYVGGLVGENWFGTITNCYATGSVSGDYRVGGLVGSNRATITNCYSTGGVTGGSYVGGLVGYHRYSTISNSYSTASVSGYSYVGGLVGYDYRGTVTASFWDIDTSGQADSDGGTGLLTDQMQMENTFTDAGWDFTTPVWTIDEGVDYPRLWWEISPVLHAEPEMTLGTTNTITWEPVPGGVEYYAECAEDANFTSIIYNTGWITETSYEFTDLELCKRYWYSVKAANSAGVETGWSNVESSLQVTLTDAVDMALDPDTLKNENMKSALLNKINSVLKMLDDGLYEEALNKLQNDILQKTNGCAETGQPDKNDWIITCQEQSEIYPLIIETIEYVNGLMNQ